MEEGGGDAVERRADDGHGSQQLGLRLDLHAVDLVHVRAGVLDQELPSVQDGGHRIAITVDHGVEVGG